MDSIVNCRLPFGIQSVRFVCSGLCVFGFFVVVLLPFRFCNHSSIGLYTCQTTHMCANAAFNCVLLCRSAAALLLTNTHIYLCMLQHDASVLLCWHDPICTGWLRNVVSFFWGYLTTFIRSVTGLESERERERERHDITQYMQQKGLSYNKYIVDQLMLSRPALTLKNP